jgi:hypothetical protein
MPPSHRRFRISKTLLGKLAAELLRLSLRRRKSSGLSERTTLKPTFDVLAIALRSLHGPTDPSQFSNGVLLGVFLNAYLLTGRFLGGSLFTPGV